MHIEVQSVITKTYYLARAENTYLLCTTIAHQFCFNGLVSANLLC